MAVTQTGPNLVNVQCLAEEAFKRGPVTVVTLNRLMVEKTARNWGQIRSHKSATLKHVPPKAKIMKGKLTGSPQNVISLGGRKTFYKL